MPKKPLAWALRHVATQHTYARNRTMESAMQRFFNWLDKLAMASPYAAFTLFQIH